MNMGASSLELEQVRVLLRGEPEPINSSLQRCTLRRTLLYIGVIVLGAGCFGAVVGSWRAPLQALFTAIKFPAILLLTALGNGLLNGMFAPLLGLNLNFRQALLAILMSFTIAAAILGAFSPILYFMIWNSPPLEQQAHVGVSSYRLLLLTQTAAIAFAGIAANLRLMQLLRHISGKFSVARNVLMSWLAVNLLLGAQLSWNLRPFVGSPGLPVEFFRHNALEGNFFEAVLYALRHLSS
jgi:hypothetical protein